MIKMIALLAFLTVPVSSFAEQFCMKAIKDDKKTELENLSAYVSRFIPTKSEGYVFIGGNHEYFKYRIPYSDNGGHHKQWFACINSEVESFDVVRDDSYELLLARIEYFKQAVEGRRSKSEIASDAAKVCFADHSNSRLEAYYDCDRKISEDINNRTFANEFSEELFKSIETLAENGNLMAQYNMVNMKLDGVGTKIDVLSAYAWGLVATTVNPPFGKKVVDDIYKYLNPDERREAELLSIKYLMNYSKIYERPSITILNPT